MICKDLVEYAAKLIASSPLYLEVRQLYVVDSSAVKDLLKQPFTVLKKVNVGITDKFEIFLEEELTFSFEENIFFYIVFYNPTLDLLVMPEWCPEVMIGSKAQSLSIKSKNNGCQVVYQLPEVLKLSKFDILNED